MDEPLRAGETTNTQANYRGAPCYCREIELPPPPNCVTPLIVNHAQRSSEQSVVCDLAANIDEALICGDRKGNSVVLSLNTFVQRVAMVAAFLLTIAGFAQWAYSTAPTRASETTQPAVIQPNKPIDPAEVERCKVPEFAKKIGHEEQWKLHNNCK